MERLWAPWRMSYITGPKPAAGQCVFCEAFGQVDDPERFVLFADEGGLVMLNLYPYTSGHLLVLPKTHAPDLLALSAPQSARLGLLLRASMRQLKAAVNCQGANLGMNMGQAGGAGIESHVHWHIVPRWLGDTNYMAVLDDVRIINQHLSDTHRELLPHFQRLSWTGEDYAVT